MAAPAVDKLPADSLWKHCRRLRKPSAPGIETFVAGPSARGRTGMGAVSCLCDVLILSGLGVSAGMALQADDLVNNGGTHSSRWA